MKQKKHEPEYMKSNFQISHNRENYTKPILFHSHDFFEIYFFLDGNVTYYIENEVYTLTKGDILIIPPGKLHRPVIEGIFSYDRYVLWLYSHYISCNEGLSRMVNEIIVMISEKRTRRISFSGNALRTQVALFDKLLSDFQSEDALSHYTAESCIMLILGEILAHFKCLEKVSEEQEDVVRQIISYLNANITHAPSLNDLSEKFFVSKYYLSHKFKEHTKTTIHQYILMKKINLAKELLEKGYSPQEVCRRCDFSTYSNFYKAFTQQTGSSPRDYPKKLHRQLPPGI